WFASCYGFFFSSRRRHTRSTRDWSSDVCSSDLIVAKVTRDRIMRGMHRRYPEFDFAHNKGYGTPFHRAALRRHGPTPIHRLSFRSEERRVGKECGCRRWREDEMKK